ncbi:hypothetical protein AGIG_G7980 [Arapaima gigas]
MKLPRRIKVPGEMTSCPNRYYGKAVNKLRTLSGPPCSSRGPGFGSSSVASWSKTESLVRKMEAAAGSPAPTDPTFKVRNLLLHLCQDK